jgi:hypothetical protein
VPQKLPEKIGDLSSPLTSSSLPLGERIKVRGGAIRILKLISGTLH